MVQTSTIVKFPEPDKGGDATSVTRADARVGVPSGVLARLHGIEDEAALARGLLLWRGSATAGGDLPRFTLAGKLGRGSQGVVYALKDLDCQRTVAIKTLSGTETTLDEVSRFLNEVQITAQLEHPGVVPVHDLGVLPDGTVFYTMKRVEGQALGDWLEGRSGKEAHRFEVIQLFLKICDTMAFAHSRGVIHRDLKPRNVMIGTYGEALVMDWGLAKIVGREDPLLSQGSDVQVSPMADHETLQGTAVGTPAYMSPEQASGDLAAVDHRADIYGLGVLLYEMLCGTSPYIRGDVRNTLRQVVSGKWTRLNRRQIEGRLPRRLVAIVHKAMEHRCDDRYQHVSEMAADLRSFLAGEAVSAHRESLPERLVRGVDRHRHTLAWLAAVVLVVAACVGTAMWWFQRRDRLEVDSLRDAASRAWYAGDWAAVRAANEKILAFLPNDREARDQAAKADREKQKDDTQRTQRAQAADLRGQAATAAAGGTLADLEKAVALCGTAQTLHPESDLIGEDYRRHLAALSRLREEQRQDETAVQRRQSASDLADRAEKDVVAGHLDDAIGKLSRAIELAPDPARVARLGELAETRSRLQEAEAQRLREDEQRVERARRRAEADAAFVRAQELLGGGDPEAAQELVARAEGLAADHPELSRMRQLIAEGLRRKVVARAEALLGQAEVAVRASERLRNELAERREEIRRLRIEINEGGDPGRRSILATAEDASATTTRNRAQRLADAVGLLNQALAIAADHRPVRTALTSFWIDRLREAEDEGDSTAAAAAEAQARAFDDGANRELLDRLGRVANRGRGEVLLQAIGRASDRTDAVIGEPVRIQPGAEAPLLRGRYLASCSDGTRLAVRVERGRTLELAMPAAPTALHPGTAFIPGGEVRDESGRSETRVPPFAMMLREVTCGEWLEYINDAATQDEMAEALDREVIRVPRTQFRLDDKDTELWRRRGFIKRRGAFGLETTGDHPVAVDPASPVANISHDDAVAYAAWRARRDGRPWRLPTVAEWQIAVQGGDGRAHPWGDASDLLFCASALAAAKDASLGSGPGGRFQTDRSVQGVQDLAGSRSEFCAGGSGLSPDLRPLMGGSVFERVPDRFNAWARRDVDRRLVHPGWGLRLVYTP